MMHSRNNPVYIVVVVVVVVVIPSVSQSVIYAQFLFGQVKLIVRLSR